jgi:GNAT superfamily N-acetyltransferase
MRYPYFILRLLLCGVASQILACHIPQIKQASYVIIRENDPENKRGTTTILYQKDDDRPNIRIGAVRFQMEGIDYLSKTFFGSNTQQFYIESLKIDPEYQQQSLGSYLLKHTLATICSQYGATDVYWLATPLGYIQSKKIYDIQKKKLIEFYTKNGASFIPHSYNPLINMHYPAARAYMIASLLPVLHPHPVSKQERIITLGNRSYITSPHDALGIIAQYMN